VIGGFDSIGADFNSFEELIPENIRAAIDSFSNKTNGRDLLNEPIFDENYQKNKIREILNNNLLPDNNLDYYYFNEYGLFNGREEYIELLNFIRGFRIDVGQRNDTFREVFKNINEVFNFLRDENNKKIVSSVRDKELRKEYIKNIFKTCQLWVGQIPISYWDSVQGKHSWKLKKQNSNSVAKILSDPNQYHDYTIDKIFRRTDESGGLAARLARARERIVLNNRLVNKRPILYGFDYLWGIRTFFSNTTGSELLKKSGVTSEREADLHVTNKETWGQSVDQIRYSKGGLSYINGLPVRDDSYKRGDFIASLDEKQIYLSEDDRDLDGNDDDDYLDGRAAERERQWGDRLNKTERGI